jgi:hypothetical protein
MRYRIGVINDFKNTYAFIDYQNYGTLHIWDGCATSGVHKGYQLADDHIYIFLNFKQIKKTKSYSEAEETIIHLLREAPVDLSDLSFYMKMY